MRNNSWLYILLICFACFSCEVNESLTPRDYPFVETIGISSIDEMGSILDFEIKHFGSGQIISYGVEFLEKENFIIQNYEGGFYIHEIKGKPEGDQGSIKITHDLIPNVEYVAYPFIKTLQHKISGKPVFFTSKGSSAPEILTVSKSTLGLNYNFIVTGKNFSSKKEFNKVEVLGAENYFDFFVKRASRDSLVINVFPKTYRFGNIEDRFDLKIQSHDQVAIVLNQFNIDYPRILSISTLEVKPGDEIFVNTNLENKSEFIYLTVNLIGGYGVQYLYIPLEEVDENYYKCIFPEFPKGNYKLGLYSSFIIDETNGGGTHIFYDQNIQVISN